jgi:hypothetical protein
MQRESSVLSRRSSVLVLTLAITAGCGGSAGDKEPPSVTLRASTTTLRAESTARVTFTISEAPLHFGPQALSMRGGLLHSFTQVSDRIYTAEFISTTSHGEKPAITIPAGAFSDSTGNGNHPASIEFEVDERPPLAYAGAPIRPLIYTPDTSHSYYSPTYGTFNAAYTTFDSPVAHGEDFPSSFLVQAQFALTLAHISRDGSVKWTYPSAGRFVTANDDHIFVNDMADTGKVDVLNHLGQRQFSLQFARSVNYVRAEGDKLVVAYNTLAPVDVFEWDGSRIGELLFSSTAVSHARAARLNGSTLVIADTFGHRVVLQDIETGAVLDTYSTWFPNDLELRGDFLYVVEEHFDRIVAVNQATDRRFVVMAAPRSWKWDSDLAPGTDWPEYCGTEVPRPRSLSSDACSGMDTLYAPNGIALLDQGIFVADTDNSRVVYIEDGKVLSVLVGLNNPVKVVPVVDIP